MIKGVVKLVIKVSIYSMKEELHETTEAYLLENHKEFFNKFFESR